MERTLVLIKPDAIERKLMGRIMTFYENKGLEIVELKMLKASRELAERHYEEHKGKPYFEKLVNFITEGRLCALVVEGEGAIELVRKINGKTDPLKAEYGSIRGTYANETTRNLVHASDCPENAEREIKIWFE